MILLLRNLLSLRCCYLERKGQNTFYGRLIFSSRSESVVMPS